MLRRFPAGHCAVLARKVLQPTLKAQQRRWKSVVTLDGGDAIAKFRAGQTKSVLYFTATWCPPCKAIAPVYAEMATRFDDVGFGKIDIDDNQESAAEFEIRAVPTFVFSQGEKVVNKFSGADKDQLEKLVQDL